MASGMREGHIEYYITLRVDQKIGEIYKLPNNRQNITDKIKQIRGMGGDEGIPWSPLLEEIGTILGICCTLLTEP